MISPENILDRLWASSRYVENLRAEMAPVWNDERSRKAEQIYFRSLATQQEQIPGELFNALKCITESDVFLNQSWDLHHEYCQIEAEYLYRLGESKEEALRAYNCSDVSRTRCNSSSAMAEHSLNLVYRANSTTLNFI
jgi:hypothetical protein